MWRRTASSSREIQSSFRTPLRSEAGMASKLPLGAPWSSRFAAVASPAFVSIRKRAKPSKPWGCGNRRDSFARPLLGRGQRGLGLLAEPRQVAVRRPRGLASLGDRPHDQRLAATRVAACEDAGHRRGVVLVGHVAALVELDPQLLE